MKIIRSFFKTVPFKDRESFTCWFLFFFLLIPLHVDLSEKGKINIVLFVLLLLAAFAIYGQLRDFIRNKPWTQQKPV